METNRLIAILVAVAVIVLVAFFMLVGNSSVLSTTEDSEYVCPNGIPKAPLVVAEKMTQEATLRWLDNTLSETRKTLEERELNYSAEGGYEDNLTSRRSVMTMIKITKGLEYQMEQFKAMSEEGQSDPCQTLSNASLSTLLGAVELIMGDVASMVQLSELSSNGSSCYSNDSLEGCLELRWKVASMALQTPRQPTSPETMPQSCLDPPWDDTDAWSLHEFISNLPQGDVEKEKMKVEYNEALLNAHKKAWKVLKMQYDEAAKLGDDEESLITKIVVSETIIQFNEYYQGLKEAGCA